MLKESFAEEKTLKLNIPTPETVADKNRSRAIFQNQLALAIQPRGKRSHLLLLANTSAQEANLSFHMEAS